MDLWMLLAATSCSPGKTDTATEEVEQETAGEADPLDTDDDGDGFTENEGDCNDEDGRVYPGAEDIYGDGLDTDCDGGDGVDLDGDGHATQESGRYRLWSASLRFWCW